MSRPGELKSPASNAHNRKRNVGRKSKVESLPQPDRKELEQELIASNFSKYHEHEARLADRGIKVGKSSIQRFGINFQNRVKAIRTATEQAKAVVNASPDDDNAMNDALIRLVQERVFSLLVEANVENLPAKVLAQITKAIADVGRASVQQKKYMGEVRAKLQLAADDVENAAKNSGVSDEFAEFVIKRIMGVQA
jgi:Protein of unknown function (DUF3486)